LDILRATCKPGVLSRLDDIVRFDARDQAELASIVDLQIEHMSQRLSDRPISLEVTQGAEDWLALEGYDPAFGARPLRRLVQRESGDKLARALLAGDVVDGDSVVVDLPEDPEANVLEPRPQRGPRTPADSPVKRDLRRQLDLRHRARYATRAFSRRSSCRRFSSLASSRRRFRSATSRRPGGSCPLRQPGDRTALRPGAGPRTPTSAAGRR